MDSQAKIGPNIKRARLKANMTQVEVAEKAGITPTYFAMIERGEANPSFEKLEKVLNVLNLKITIKQ